MSALRKIGEMRKDTQMKNSFERIISVVFSGSCVSGRHSFLLAVIGPAILAVGCASNPAPAPPPPGGGESLAVFMKDAPADSALSVQVTVNSVSAVKSGGQSVMLSNTPRTYELKHLSLAPTLTTVQNLAAGSYTGITLALSNPQMQVLDANGNLETLDATTTPSITLAQSSVTVPLSFSIASKANGGVVLDFDLAKSLSVDNSANVILTPSLTAAVAASADPVPQLTSSVGTVSALAKNGAGFDFQLVESGATVHVTTDSNTFFDAAVQKFSNIAVGQLLEINAYLATDGSYLAKGINGSASSLANRQQGLLTGTYQNSAGQTVLSIAVQN